MVFRGWSRLWAPPCLCSAPPFLPSCSIFWALVREVLSKRARNRFFWRLVLPGLLHGEGDTVKELRGCQAQVTPSVPFPLSECMCVCLWVAVYVLSPGVSCSSSLCVCPCVWGEVTSLSSVSLSCHLSASVSLSLPPALSWKVCGSHLSTAVSIAVHLPFSLGLPYPHPLPSPLLNVGSEPWRQNEESGSAELLEVSLGLCSLLPSPSSGHPGLPVHSASLEGPEPVPQHGILGNPKLLRALGP